MGVRIPEITSVQVPFLTLISYVCMNQASMQRMNSGAAGPGSGGANGTLERLLDVAERLFAEHGYDGVGMRALAEAARVNLNAATYHFGTKENLYVETFMRRLRPANAARLDALRATEARSRGKPVRVDVIVDCLVRAPFLMVLAHPCFAALLTRNLSTPPSFLRETLERELVPVLEAFQAALGRALPMVTPDRLRLRLVLATGAVLMAVTQLSRLPAAATAQPEVVEALLRTLVGFVTAGLKSPAESGRPSPLPSIPFLPPRA